MGNIYTVEFVYSDEATPRDTHTRTVRAANAEDARREVSIAATLRGDRIQTTGTYTNSNHR